MDSYNLNFEKMSNLDLHPLSLPLSRLSPAKSTSSIDQFTYHHGKGDSAYSSFSGGSNAPDYPFLPDDLQHHSLHYADLKYVKAIYHPNVLDSDAKSMDQLYRSMEAISNQYRNNNGCLSATQYCDQNQEKLPPPPPQLPPPPDRLDSFIATRNLENCRAQHSPEGQLADRSPPRPRTANPDAACLRPDRVYGRRASQPYHRDPVNSDHMDKNPEQQTSANILSRSPPRMSQPEQHPNQQAGGGGHSEGHRKRTQEPRGSLLPEPPQSAIPLHVAQNMVNSSIQHKGQFYFVTGVCKSSESSLKHGSLCVSGEGSESPVSEPVDRERLHSTMDHMFRNTQQRHYITHDTTTTDVREFYTKSQDRSQDEVKQTRSRISYGPSHILNQRSRSSDALQQSLKVQSREIGRHHSPNHHIFSCGREENCPLLSNSHSQEVPPPISMEQATHHKRDEQINAGRRRPLGGVASQKINKENTPLLYHLTGANRAALNLNLKPKDDIEVSMQGEDAGLNAAHEERQAPVSCSDRTPHGETSKEESTEAIAHPCNMLDDSFKKYYKEKLKGAQDKVLRETSFKRSDLQLSWPHRVRQRPELRPTVLHTVSSSQDSETSADTLTPSPTHSEGTDKEDIKEMLKEVEKESVVKDGEKENGRPANIAQPQLARIGGRRCLTSEQKKLCYSEPEKLNQLGDSGEVGLLVLSGDEEELGEQGLVAARRKMFETKGRALSTSSLSKTSLQHLQHKALVAYMERKTGLKVAKPQQPAPQASQSPNQRHSMAGKPSDWGLKPQSGNKGGLKKKLYRPHSAGCVLDSTSSSMKYAQFSSGSSQSGGHSHQASWRESPSPSQGKSASVESLLDQPEPPELFRNRFPSTPHAFQGHNYMNDPSPVNAMDTSSAQTQRPVDEESVVVRRDQAMLVPEGQRVRVMGRRVRMVVKRGKSLEELGVSQVSSSSLLSESSEQLGQLRSRQGAPGPGQEKISVSSFSESQEKAQGQTQRKPLFKQDSAPQLGSREKSREMTKSTRMSTTPNSPESNTSSQVRARSDGSPGSYNFVTLVKEVVETTGLSCDVTLPPSPNVQQSSERLVKSTSTFPSIHTHPSGTGESKTGSNVKTAPPIQHTVEREQSVDEPIETPQPEASQEVSLSCGVTTDPTLWVIPPEPGSQVEDEGPALSDNLTEGETLAPAPAASEPLTTSSTTPDPDTDTCQSGEGQHPGEDKETEKETPAGETESPEKTPTTEEPKWEELVEDVVTADQSLARVLYPLTNRKTALMLMEQLLSEDTLLMEEHYKKKQRESSMTLHAADGSKTVDDPEAPPTSPVDEEVQPQPEPLSKMDVTEKKRLLVTCIEERLLALGEPRGALQVEVKENGMRGEAVEALVREHCTAVELERYGLFVGDLERVVSLLLCLSARLARVQNALSTVDQHTDAEEKDSLDNRHRLLCKQREDAKDLKDNLDRREQMVSNFLSRCLTAEQLQDYRRFVQTKASLLIRMKDLDETQRLGEEQLESLLNTLPP
ncbi:protein Shroom3 isoform X2 [Salmo salar]|uniref:Protein Shroom3 isoform X2 n=1 Tax=Salmo salar TaxID=8030 RepID=A0A1S3RP87_SALSA|nr:protein Shroom3-like isoform X2 [Salmo salar]|eukprot:XP_014053524.1 PREDICTED: protein Shroom3-like isoform X2 [Salmo salar]